MSIVLLLSFLFVLGEGVKGNYIMMPIPRQQKQQEKTHRQSHLMTAFWVICFNLFVSGHRRMEEVLPMETGIQNVGLLPLVAQFRLPPPPATLPMRTRTPVVRPVLLQQGEAHLMLIPTVGCYHLERLWTAGLQPFAWMSMLLH